MTWKDARPRSCNSTRVPRHLGFLFVWASATGYSLTLISEVAKYMCQWVAVGNCVPLMQEAAPAKMACPDYWAELETSAQPNKPYLINCSDDEKIFPLSI